MHNKCGDAFAGGRGQTVLQPTAYADDPRCGIRVEGMKFGNVAVAVGRANAKTIFAIALVEKRASQAVAEAKATDKRARTTNLRLSSGRDCEDPARIQSAGHGLAKRAPGVLIYTPEGRTPGPQAIDPEPEPCMRKDGSGQSAGLIGEPIPADEIPEPGWSLSLIHI